MFNKWYSVVNWVRIRFFFFFYWSTKALWINFLFVIVVYTWEPWTLLSFTKVSWNFFFLFFFFPLLLPLRSDEWTLFFSHFDKKWLYLPREKRSLPDRVCGGETGIVNLDRIRKDVYFLTSISLTLLLSVCISIYLSIYYMQKLLTSRRLAF